MPKIKIFILITFLISSFFVFEKVEAGAEHNVSGWAWSENIGWISFNSTNCDPNNDGESDGATDCPPVETSIANYGVNINPSTGVFSGYAWSENIGWITFNAGELTDCPIGTCEARLDLTEAGTYCGAKYKVCGWAKVLSHDGINWPTWIRLRDTNYGVWWDPPDNQELKGWAYGDIGVGWMSFNCENCEGTTCDTYYPACDNLAHPDYKVIAALDIIHPTVGPISPTVCQVNVPTNFSANVLDNIGVTNCWLYVEGVNDGEMTLSPSPCPSCTATKSHTFTSTGDYSLYAFCKDEAGNYTGGPAVTVAVTEFGPLICNINVPTTGLVNQWFLINVSGSKGAIAGVRFASNLVGEPTGSWTNWYGWTASSGDWNATSKIMKWSFASAGNYEVWAELKDSGDSTVSCHAPNTILIFEECYPWDITTCLSLQGCSHTITCQSNGIWPSCPTDACSPGDTPQNCGVDGIRTCTDSCIWGPCVEPPPGGECTWPPDITCPICQHPECNTTTGDWECQPDLAGTDCGDCRQCDSLGNCNNICSGSESSCECISDVCIDCSIYYDHDPGGPTCGILGIICSCGPCERHVWSCSYGQCVCNCSDFDTTCDPACEPDGCQRNDPGVTLDPPSQSGNPGDTLTYNVSVQNWDLNCDPSTFDLTPTCPSDWPVCILTPTPPSLTINAGESDSSITLTVRSSSNAPRENYNILVTAYDSVLDRSGYGNATYQVLNNPPSVRNLSADATGLCSVTYPPVYLSWEFDDQDLPSGDYQSAYQVQVDNNSDFGSPENDSCVPAPGTCGSGHSSPTYSPISGLEFDATYYWRVRVWDNEDAPSNWAEAPSSFHTEPKYPRPEFDWTPKTPSAGGAVQFCSVYEGVCPEDLTEFYDTNPGGRSWSWDFGDGTPISYQPNPIHNYSDPSPLGGYVVTLEVTDGVGYGPCEISHNLRVTLPLPKWKEIAPF